MSDYEFYETVLKTCDGCPAYEYLGHCGFSPCITTKVLNFIFSELHWDEDYFLGYIYFQDYILPEIYQEEDIFWQELADEMFLDSEDWTMV